MKEIQKKKLICYNTLCCPKHLTLEQVVMIKDKLNWLLWEPAFVDELGWVKAVEIIDLEPNDEPIPLILNYNELTTEQLKTLLDLKD